MINVREALGGSSIKAWGITCNHCLEIACYIRFEPRIGQVVKRTDVFLPNGTQPKEGEGPVCPYCNQNYRPASWSEVSVPIEVARCMAENSLKENLQREILFGTGNI